MKKKTYNETYIVEKKRRKEFTGYRSVPLPHGNMGLEKEKSFNQELFDAVHARNILNLQSLIAKGSCLTSATETGYTVLMLAAENGDTEILNLLISSKRILINQTDKWKYTALIRAAIQGRLESVQILLAVDSIDVNAFDGYGNTALIHAAERGHIHIVKALLDAGACNVKFSITGGDNATVAAFKNGHNHVVSLLEGYNTVLPQNLKQKNNPAKEAVTLPICRMALSHSPAPVIFSDRSDEGKKENSADTVLLPMTIFMPSFEHVEGVANPDSHTLDKVGTVTDALRVLNLEKMNRRRV